MIRAFRKGKLYEVHTSYNVINEKKRANAQAQQEIDTLRKKIFGKKKANQQAEEIEKAINQRNSEKESLQQQLEILVQEENKRKDAKLRELGVKKKQAKDERDKLLQQKKEIMSGYSDLVCYYGPEATVTPSTRILSIEEKY